VAGRLERSGGAGGLRAKSIQRAARASSENARPICPTGPFTQFCFFFSFSFFAFVECC
jgi:hypothetical protein